MKDIKNVCYRFVCVDGQFKMFKVVFGKKEKVAIRDLPVAWR